MAEINADTFVDKTEESPYISATNNNDSGIEEVMVRRTETGEKVWDRTRCLGGGWLDYIILFWYSRVRGLIFINEFFN